MTTRTYHAVTMSQALSDVKRDLGRDAVILKTRRVRKGGMLGLGGKKMWEIIAAPHAVVPRRATKGKYSPARSAGTAAEAHSPRPIPIPLAEAAVTHAAQADCQLADIHKMVEELLQKQNRHGGHLPPELEAFYAHLLRQDVEEDVARSLMDDLRKLTSEELADKQLIRQRLAEAAASRIAVATPADVPAGRSRVIALIGSTGVGKTTTIAKLAANFKIKEGKRVGLITIDTYRIAAVDQLKTYAEIINVPLKVVLSTGELQQAVASFGDLDVVLIDTAGRSQNDQLRLNQMRAFISAAAADEVHLVVAATASRSTAKSSVECFAPLGVNRIILTKLDEAGTFGTILNVTASRKAALSYVTTGQDVPDDIQAADVQHLTGCIMRGSLYAS